MWKSRLMLIDAAWKTMKGVRERVLSRDYDDLQSGFFSHQLRCFTWH